MVSRVKSGLAIKNKTGTVTAFIKEIISFCPAVIKILY